MIYRVVPQFVNAKLVQICIISLWFMGDIELVHGIILSIFITGEAPPFLEPTSLDGGSLWWNHLTSAMNLCAEEEMSDLAASNIPQQTLV